MRATVHMSPAPIISHDPPPPPGVRSGRVARRAARASRFLPRGAAMLAVLVMIIACSIVLTAGISLLGARLQQSEYLGTEVQRHVIWGNTRAINQQYAHT